MKSSELRAQLEALEKEHGDLEMFMLDSIGLHFPLTVGLTDLYTHGKAFSICKVQQYSRQKTRPYFFEIDKDKVKSFK